MGNALEILVLQVVAQYACGDEAGAMERLSQALSLAEPEGYIRLFVDEGSTDGTFAGADAQSAARRSAMFHALSRTTSGGAWQSA